MTSIAIFLPVLLTAAISLLLLILNAYRKNVARGEGAVDERAAIDNRAWPLPVVLTSNALENQFQFPILFYVLCFILLELNAVNGFSLALAWGYALIRCAHAFVHISSNNIPTRMTTFGLSMIVLLVLFIYTLIQTISHV